jgi:hypothetical protein
MTTLLRPEQMNEGIGKSIGFAIAPAVLAELRRGCSCSAGRLHVGGCTGDSATQLNQAPQQAASDSSTDAKIGGASLKT